MPELVLGPILKTDTQQPAILACAKKCPIFDCIQSIQNVIHDTTLFVAMTITPSQVSHFSRMGFDMRRKYELALVQLNKVLTDN